MSPLLLICDPTYDYTRSFHEMLANRNINSRYVRTAEDCLQEIRLFAPDFVLVSCETDDGFIAPLLDGIERTPARSPKVFLIGDAPSQVLSDTWGCSPESCLMKPFDEANFVRRLAALSERPAMEGTEREDGVGGSGFQPAGLTAWENEGGSVPAAPRWRSSRK